MKNLEILLDQFESRIPLFEKENLAISKSNIGWHIEHSLLTLNGVIKFLTHSNPKDYKWKFNFIRIIVMKTGKIPRGKVKAPQIVVPKDTISKTQLLANLEQTRKLIL
jgi:hypothetical protein